MKWDPTSSIFPARSKSMHPKVFISYHPERADFVARNQQQALDSLDELTKKRTKEIRGYVSPI